MSHRPIPLDKLPPLATGTAGLDAAQVQSQRQFGFSEADLGRHIRNAGQREWIRTNVHNRGQAPAVGKAGGAKPGGAHYGKHGGNPG